MPTFFHAPNSRSTTIAMAIEEMGLSAEIETKITTVPRQDGSGGPDAANPHPDKKVPALLLGETVVTERAAILALLCELYPQAPTAVPPGHPQRGPFLSWLAFYAGVFEPAIMCQMTGVDHPAFMNLVLGLDVIHKRLESTVTGQDYLLPTGFSAADLLVASPYMWMPDLLPERPAIQAWVERVMARPAVQAVGARDNPA